MPTPDSPHEERPKPREQLERMRHDTARRDAQEEVRKDIAAVVGRQFSAGHLKTIERKIAIEIFEILARDVAQRVREALVEHVKACPFLPAPLARRMACDIESVALPVLHHTSALDEETLLAMARGAAEAKQFAIAERARASETVSEVLVDVANRRVVHRLLASPGAEVAEPSLHRALDGFDDDADLQRLIIDRNTLPLVVVQRLIGHVSAELQARLVSQHDIPVSLAEELVMQGRELALIEMATREEQPQEVHHLAFRLHLKGELTPTLVLRALCVGDLAFFEAAIAVLANTPPAAARQMLFACGMDELQEIYAKSGLPRELFRAVMAAIQVVHELERENVPMRQKEYTRLVIARMTMHYRDTRPADLERVLAQVSRRILGEVSRPAAIPA